MSKERNQPEAAASLPAHGPAHLVPDLSIDDLRERSFYPRPHERNNTFMKRAKNWLRARLGIRAS